MAVLQQFGILFVLGSLGILMYTLTSVPLIQQQLAGLPPEAAADVPPLHIVMLLMGLQSLVLLAIAILVGIGCTRAVGLHSHVIDYLVFRAPKLLSIASEIKWSLGIGTAATLVILVINRLMEPALPAALRAANQAESSWLTSLTAILYGGLTEEIFDALGIDVAPGLGRVEAVGAGRHVAKSGDLSRAIVVAATLFGLLHLPATAAITPLTPIMIIRALLLNGIAGIAYGWLFWQFSLEAAMLAHASFHAFAFALSLLFRELPELVGR